MLVSKARLGGQPAPFYEIEKCLGTYGVSLPSVVQIWRGGVTGAARWRRAQSKHLALGHIPSPPISFREQGRSQIRWDKGGFYSGLKVITVSPSVPCLSLLIADGLLAHTFLSRLRAGSGPRGCPGDKAWGSEGVGTVGHRSNRLFRSQPWVCVGVWW